MKARSHHILSSGLKSHLFTLLVAVIFSACQGDEGSSDDTPNNPPTHTPPGKQLTRREAVDLEERASQVLFTDTGISLYSWIDASYDIETFSYVFFEDSLSSSGLTPTLGGVLNSLQTYLSETAQVLPRMTEEFLIWSD